MVAVDGMIRIAVQIRTAVRNALCAPTGKLCATLPVPRFFGNRDLGFTIYTTETWTVFGAI